MDIISSLSKYGIKLGTDENGNDMYEINNLFEKYPSKSKLNLCQKFRCPNLKCQLQGTTITNDSPVKRTVVDINRFGRIVSITILRPRKRCSQCRKSFYSSNAFFLSGNSPFSRDFQKAVIDKVLFTQSTFSSIATQYKISINTTKNFIKQCKELNEAERIKIVKTPVVTISPFKYKNKTSCYISGYTRVGSTYKKGILGVIQNYTEKSIMDYLEKHFVDKNSVKIVICKLNKQAIVAAKKVFHKAEIVINHKTFNDDIFELIPNNEYDLTGYAFRIQDFCRKYKKQDKMIIGSQEEIERYHNKKWIEALDDLFNGFDLSDAERIHLNEIYEIFNDYPMEILRCIEAMQNHKIVDEVIEKLPKSLHDVDLLNTKDIEEIVKHYKSRAYKFTDKEFSTFAMRLMFLNPAVRDVLYYEDETSKGMRMVTVFDAPKRKIKHGYYVDVKTLLDSFKQPDYMNDQCSKFYQDEIAAKNKLLYFKKILAKKLNIVTGEVQEFLY